MAGLKIECCRSPGPSARKGAQTDPQFDSELLLEVVPGGPLRLTRGHMLARATSAEQSRPLQPALLGFRAAKPCAGNGGMGYIPGQPLPWRSPSLACRECSGTKDRGRACPRW